MANTDFQERLARIAGKEECLDNSASAEGYANEASLLVEFFMVPLVFVSGILSVFIGRWLQFHYLTDPDIFGEVFARLAGGFIGNVLAPAAVFSIVILLLGRNDGIRCNAGILGFLIGLFFPDLLLLFAPEALLALFSDEWLAIMVFSAI